MRKRIPLETRFWRHVNKTSYCWLWTGTITGGRSGKPGYGYFRLGSTAKRAHRVAWLLTNGPIPAGLAVLHKCDNPPCVRPDHLFLGTRSDNALDMLAKDRARGAVKLTARQRAEIRAKYTGRHGDLTRLGQEYGVTKQAVSWIVKHGTS